VSFEHFSADGAQVADVSAALIVAGYFDQGKNERHRRTEAPASGATESLFVKL
jgi:hypothetical protein